MLPRRFLFKALLAAAFLPLAAEAAKKKRAKKRALDLKKVARGKYLRSDAAEAFLRMAEAAKDDGITLRVRSAHRTRAQQLRLFKRWLAKKGPRAARPGTSRHEDGTAVDLRWVNETTRTYRWMVKNARRFGFVKTVRSEPWHWEYVGAPEEPRA